MSEGFVCIGGPIDGEWRALSSGQTFLTVMERDPMPMVALGPGDMREASVRTHTYKLQNLGRFTREKPVHALVHENVDWDDAMTRLVVGYRPAGKSQEIKGGSSSPPPLGQAPAHTR